MSFAELVALCRELKPERQAYFTSAKDGVIAIMGRSEAESFIYRCGRDSCGDAMTPSGYYTYYIVRDGDESPQVMSDWSAFARQPCSWEQMADAIRRVAALSPAVKQSQEEMRVERSNRAATARKLATELNLPQSIIDRAASYAVDGGSPEDAVRRAVVADPGYVPTVEQALRDPAAFVEGMIEE